MALTKRDRRDLNEIFKRMAQFLGYRWDGFEQGDEIGDAITESLTPLNDLASTDADKGASLVAVRDADDNFSGDDVEAILAELAERIATVSNDLAVDAATELTIADGVVTTTQAYHSIDTEADAGSDDLDTISGPTDGKLLFVKLANAARNVVLKHGTGNLSCPGGEDVTLDAANDCALIFRQGSTNVVLAVGVVALAGAGLGAALASTSASKGASLVGIQDVGSLITATTVEAALAELRTTLVTKAATELTIASGAVTATQTAHRIDTESDGASDDLDTINGGVAEMLLLVRPESGSRTVVLKHNTGNIICPGAQDISLADAQDFALLVYANSKWTVVAWHTLVAGNGGLGALLASVANGKGASLVGVEDAGSLFSATTVEAALAEIRTSLLAKPATELTIATGAITATQSYHTIDTESDGASDDLDSIAGLTDGQFAIFRLENAARNVVFKHGTGNIVCPGGFDVTLDATQDLALVFRLGASNAVVGLQLATLSGGGLGLALASSANGQGASRVALEDAASLYATDNVEAALAAVRTVLVTKAATELTIASGAVTATQSAHRIDTESDGASDDLDTINGGAAEQVLLVRPESAARTVVLKHNTGNIICPAAEDISLADAQDFALLVYANSKWTVVAFHTLVGSGGGLGAQLASVSNNKGASRVAIEDASALYTAADVEAALAEVVKKANAALGVPVCVPVVLSKHSNGSVAARFTPGMAGKIRKITASVTDPATIGAKLATFTPAIAGAAVTGGALALTSENCTPVGAKIDGSAITAGNAFTAAQEITIVASSVTAFVEGQVVIYLFLDPAA